MLSKEQLSYVFIFLKLAGAYIFLSVCFYGYVGLIDPDGKVYSALLAKFSLIDGILLALIYPCTWILDIVGFTSRHANNFVGIVNGPIVYIAFPCLGIKIMIAYTSLIFAFPGRKKILFWIAGILSIQLLNICRITSIIIGYNHDEGIVNLTHDLFNYVGYAFVCLFFYIWYSRYGNFQKI